MFTVSFIEMAQAVHKISYGNKICPDERTDERGGQIVRKHIASSPTLSGGECIKTW